MDGVELRKTGAEAQVFVAGQKWKIDPNSLTEHTRGRKKVQCFISAMAFFECMCELVFFFFLHIVRNKYVSNNAMGMMAMAEKEVIYSRL